MDMPNMPKERMTAEDYQRKRLRRGVAISGALTALMGGFAVMNAWGGSILGTTLSGGFAAWNGYNLYNQLKALKHLRRREEAPKDQTYNPYRPYNPNGPLP